MWVIICNQLIGAYNTRHLIQRACVLEVLYGAVGDAVSTSLIFASKFVKFFL